MTLIPANPAPGATRPTPEGAAIVSRKPAHPRWQQAGPAGSIRLVRKETDPPPANGNGCGLEPDGMRRLRQACLPFHERSRNCKRRGEEKPYFSPGLAPGPVGTVSAPPAARLPLLPAGAVKTGRGDPGRCLERPRGPPGPRLPRSMAVPGARSRKGGPVSLPALLPAGICWRPDKGKEMGARGGLHPGRSRHENEFDISRHLTRVRKVTPGRNIVIWCKERSDGASRDAIRRRGNLRGGAEGQRARAAASGNRCHHPGFSV